MSLISWFIFFEGFPKGDSRVFIDFLHVPILGHLVVEGFITLCALYWLMALDVMLKQLWGCETFATILTRITLAMNPFHMFLHHQLVRTGIVTLLVVTLM